MNILVYFKYIAAFPSSAVFILHTHSN